MIRQKKYIKAFQRAGAVDETHATTLEELHLVSSFHFKKMIEKGIFIDCGNGRYFLNVPVAGIFSTNRQYFMRIFILILLILLLAVITGKFLT
jgi:hypothetical protein